MGKKFVPRVTAALPARTRAGRDGRAPGREEGTMTDWTGTLVKLSPGRGRVAPRKQTLAGRWVDHSARDRTLTLQTPRGRVKLAYDRALVYGVPVERLWSREHVGLALATFGRPVRVRWWVDADGDVVAEIVQGEPRTH